LSPLGAVDEGVVGQFNPLQSTPQAWHPFAHVSDRAIFEDMKLYLISGKHDVGGSQPFRVYLVAAPNRAAVDEMLPEDLALGIEGEVDGSIDHPAGIIGWVGSPMAVSINGKS
jgi:hypothetical protein